MDWLRRGMLLAVCLLAGCKHPLQVNTRVDGNVRAEVPPVNNAGPVVPIALPATGGGEQIAVIDVDGVLLNQDFTGPYSWGENPVSLFRERLDRAAAEPCVRGVVVRINSPGGGVTATDMMWHDLQTFRQRTGLPIVACLLDYGAGGGYYVATAADQIIAHPTSVTGGIGCILNLYNMQDAMAQFNVVGAPIKAGDNVDMGTPIRAATEEERELLQQMANEFHDRFRRIVMAARPAIDKSQSNFDGRVFTSRQALERKLIDSIGYLDDAVAMARQMGGAPQASVVFYHRCNDRPRSVYSVTPNVPLQTSLFPVSLPGYDRSKLPSFLYMWQPDPTLERMSGR